MKKIVLALGATALAMAPVAASAVESARSAPAIAPVEDGSEIVGVPSVLIGILAAAAVIGGIVIASDDDDDSDLPVSG